MNPKTVKINDVTEEELKDVKEFYADRKSHKVGSLKELLKDLSE
jgi:hypothetical protein